MFNGLRDGSLFYILFKGEKPRLVTGQVTAKSDPRPKNGMQTQQYLGYQSDTVVDITVKADNETYTFDALNSQDTFRFYPDRNVFITDSRDQMLAEVESMQRTSAQVLESVSYHKSVESECESIMRQLNPQLAKEKEQEEKIGALESKITGMEDKLGSIQEMLIKALGNSSKKSNDK